MTNLYLRFFLTPIFIVVCLIFVFKENLISRTTIPGQIINSNTTWTLAGSPDTVTGNVTVSSGVSLTIEPGVQVRFNSNTGLYINGALIANGKVSDSIVFTLVLLLRQHAVGGRIVFGSTATTPQSVMNYCVIKYSGDPGANGGSGAIVIDGRVNPKITNLTLYNNTYNSIQLVNAAYSQDITLDIVDKPYFTLGYITMNSRI